MSILIIILLFFLIPKTMVLGIRILVFLGVIAIIGFLLILLITLLFVEYYFLFFTLIILIGFIISYERKKI